MLARLVLVRAVVAVADMDVVVPVAMVFLGEAKGSEGSEPEAGDCGNWPRCSGWKAGLRGGLRGLWRVLAGLSGLRGPRGLRGPTGTMIWLRDPELIWWEGGGGERRGRCWCWM